MKEFELQGDIASGFRWRIKRATEVKREAFVPLGEGFVPPEDSSGAARIQNDKKMRQPSEEEIAFDPGYDPPYIPLKRPPSGEEIVFELGVTIFCFSASATPDTGCSTL